MDVRWISVDLSDHFFTGYPWFQLSPPAVFHGNIADSNKGSQIDQKQNQKGNQKEEKVLPMYLAIEGKLAPSFHNQLVAQALHGKE